MDIMQTQLVNMQMKRQLENMLKIKVNQKKIQENLLKSINTVLIPRGLCPEVVYLKMQILNTLFKL